MKVLHIIPSVSAEWGGPTEYARIMAAKHDLAGHQTEFATLDAPGAPHVESFPFPVHAFGPGYGRTNITPAFGRGIDKLAPHFDAAVVHGLWHHACTGAFSAMKRHGLPWLVFTHGMMDPYFRKEKPLKHAAKQAFWLLWQGRMLSSAHTVIFTCEEEKRLARGTFFGSSRYREKVVAFCAADQATSLTPSSDAFRAAHPALLGRDYLLFVGRIHPKKACDQLVAAFATVVDIDPRLDLVIAGPDQAGWVAALKEQAESLGIGGRIHWPGMIGGAVKQSAYANTRAFVLPSHQENFGIVVAEALSAGTPVLISDKVNIWREIEKDGAGLVAPDTVEGTSNMLRRFLTMPTGAVTEMRVAARRCYDGHFSVPQAALDLLAVLEDAASSRLRNVG